MSRRNAKIMLSDNVKMKAFDKDGNIFWTHEAHNTTCDSLRAIVVDWLDNATFSNEVTNTDISGCSSMAVGTGAAQVAADTALTSRATWENSTGSNWTASQPSAGQYKIISTFTGIAMNPATEAGLFTDLLGKENMLANDSTFSVVLTTNDSLQITWTIQTY